MNDVILSIGSFSIKWYSLLILFGATIGVLIAIREGKKFGISKEYMTNLFFYIMIFGIIGARLYFVAFNWDYYSNNLSSIYKIWEGGLAIHGGILAGIIVVAIYGKKYKIKSFKILDILVPGLIIAQAIGRWGNFLNKEAFGSETTLTFLQSLHLPEFIIEGMNINGIYYQPTFLYESLWCLIGFIIILIFRKLKHIKIGQITCLYMMWYSVGRFFIEALRTDSLMFKDIRVAQAVSIVMFAFGLVTIFILNRGSKFNNLYNSEEIENVNF